MSAARSFCADLESVRGQCTGDWGGEAAAIDIRCCYIIHFGGKICQNRVVLRTFAFIILFAFVTRSECIHYSVRYHPYI